MPLGIYIKSGDFKIIVCYNRKVQINIECCLESEDYFMKKIYRWAVLLFSSTMLFVSCGKEKDEASTSIPVIEMPDQPASTSSGAVSQEPEEDVREGMTRSVLTNQWIDESLKDQRPVAVMINNIEAALPQSGIGKAGVMYEAPVEGGLTRLLAVIDDWASLGELGPVRSCRLYYVYFALEWDAIYAHFGGPELYVKAILSEDYVHNLDGLELEGTAYHRRSRPGVSKEHTAYTSGEELLKGLEKKGYSMTYTGNYEGPHYQFASEDNPVDLSSSTGVQDAVHVEPGYSINKPYFEYHEEDGLYYRYQYGKPHIDEATGEQLAYKNILLQTTYSVSLDAKGYLGFKNHDTTLGGYYITGGKAIPVTWEKTTDFGPTKYFDQDGNEINLNTGKTFICIIQESAENRVVIR